MQMSETQSDLQVTKAKARLCESNIFKIYEVNLGKWKKADILQCLDQKHLFFAHSQKMTKN